MSKREKPIEECVKELKESPLFALSKCSNELAHTNFWAWLIELKDEKGNHPFVELFIPGFYDDNNEFAYMKVEREEQNRDLTIHYKEGGKEKYHVVENKLKAIPTEGQLDKYKTSIDTEIFGGGTLTGIEKTLEPKGWSFKSYEALADDMNQIKDTFIEKNSSDEIIIDRYIGDIKNINSIIKKMIDTVRDDYKWEIDKGKEALEEIKLADLFKKQVGCLLAKDIEEMIKQEKSTLESAWGYPMVETGYNHKRPTVTIIFKLKDKDKEKGRIGVQIEGDQFRIYGGPSNLEGILKQEEKEELFKKLKSLEWLEDSKKTIRGKSSGARGKYCSYSTNTYFHIYQYWNIKKWDVDEKIDKEKTRKQIAEEVIKELKKAKGKIDSGELDYWKDFRNNL